MSDAQVVRLEKDGDVGLIIVNYPPVNALGPGVSEGIIDCLNKANADPAIKAMVLMGDGRSFIAGADIRGFGTGRKRRRSESAPTTFWTPARSRSSPRSTATRWAAGWKTRWPATTGSPSRPPKSDFRRC